MAKVRSASRGRRGLRKLPPELIAQAQDQTTATITRIMLTFVGVALFCLLSLLTPDVALLTGGERLNVPFAGPVSTSSTGAAWSPSVAGCLGLRRPQWRHWKTRSCEASPGLCSISCCR
jgi:hypothetical protein